jgi:lysophospholipase L1-like esterase/pimeloyl-ACP methyl ester carboxylesterase
MKRLFISFILFVLAVSVFADEKGPVKIACVGNSITYGAGVRNQFQNAYPGMLQQLLGDGYDVRNFGVNGCTLLSKGDHPYVKESAYHEALDFLPDIVTIKLGTNDSKPQNWKYKKEFKQNLEKMVEAFKALSSKPTIYLCYPVPATKVQWGINEKVINGEIIPIIKRVAQKEKVRLIDLHSVLLPYPQDFPDGVHPNEHGSMLIANEIYRNLTGKTPPVLDITQPYPGIKTKWDGCDRYDFTCFGRQATVVVPEHVAQGTPWIWRPAFFGAFPSVDKELLKQGFHVVYYDLTHLYASPRSMELGDMFYGVMCRYYHLSPKVTLEGFSRGGYFVFNWAARNPDKVACIYADAPVCDIFSWPGRNNVDLWNGFLKEWGLKDAEVTPDFTGNVLCHVDQLVKAHIPVIAVCGGKDKTVPFNENMLKVRDAYQSKGGIVELILKPDCDHHPHSLENPEPVVDFIKRYQDGYARFQHINQRATLHNAFYRFTKDKEGCVAFLGGSITEMKGWRDMIKQCLQQRFSHTHFTFIDAGIPSLGSTPHAFRFENDVLKKGIPDLMFVEAAVNDDGNGFGPKEQVRGMEGIVRHALTVNPYMDMVMLHFIYDPFISILQGGGQPVVIKNHERVAEHYSVSSINLAQEIAQRMKVGEFDWKWFGGTHPAWHGHKYYAASINRLFDENQVSADSLKYVAHEIPAEPLDSFSYYKGGFVDIKEAKSLHGFNYVTDWKPQDKVSTRDGFVNVPMLEATKAGSSLILNFKGTSVGVFCIAGPRACVLEYSIDGAPYHSCDMITNWSSHLYLPGVYMLGTELKDYRHVLKLRVAKGTRTECQIRNFVVNK